MGFGGQEDRCVSPVPDNLVYCVLHWYPSCPGVVSESPTCPEVRSGPFTQESPKVFFLTLAETRGWTLVSGLSYSITWEGSSPSEVCTGESPVESSGGKVSPSPTVTVKELHLLSGLSDRFHGLNFLLGLRLRCGTRDRIPTWGVVEGRRPRSPWSLTSSLRWTVSLTPDRSRRPPTRSRDSRVHKEFPF